MINFYNFITDITSQLIQIGLYDLLQLCNIYVIVQPGTYFYHGHYGMQRSAGLYGSIHVAVANGVKEPFSYHGELSVVLNDWWHKSHQEQSTGLASIPFVWVGEPQVTKELW